MKIIIFINFLPLVILEVVQMTTSGSASDESFVNMATSLF